MEYFILKLVSENAGLVMTTSGHCSQMSDGVSTVTGCVLPQVASWVGLCESFCSTKTTFVSIHFPHKFNSSFAPVLMHTHRDSLSS